MSLADEVAAQQVRGSEQAQLHGDEAHSQGLAVLNELVALSRDEASCADKAAAQANSRKAIAASAASRELGSASHLHPQGEVQRLIAR
jgi:hypothetical protein